MRLAVSTQTYLDDVRPPLILRADTGNGNGITQSLNELVLEGIHLLEVRLEVRHLVEVFVDVWPIFFCSSLRRGKRATSLWDGVVREKALSRRHG
jgi:hypothetical protein